MHGFADVAATILEPEATPGELWTATDRMYRTLLDASGMQASEFDPTVLIDTPLAYGKAISPFDAGRCVLDLYRTQAFALGVVTAVEDRLRESTTRPVRLLYAGCGPFATLVLPAFTRFSPDELQCTLLDVHGQSIDAVARVVAALGFEAFVREAVATDAVGYQLPEGSDVDVLLIECLQRGLSSEPQVAIGWNLAAQVGPDVIHIPEEIRLHAALADPTAPVRDEATHLRRLSEVPVFVLSVEAVRAWGPWDPDTDTLPARSILARSPLAPPDALVLATTVQVRGDIELTDYRSGLTHPHLLTPTLPFPAGTTLRFEYRIKQPGIRLVDVEPIA